MRDDVIEKVWAGHCTWHATRGQADAVWAALVVESADGTYRYVPVWGKRGKPMTSRPQQLSRFLALNTADKQIVAKQREGYKPIDWRDNAYGLADAIRAQGVPRDERPDPVPPTVARPVRPPTPATPPVAPVRSRQPVPSNQRQPREFRDIDL